MSMTWQFMDNFLKSRAGRRARSGIGSSGRSIRIATGNVCGRMYVWSSRSAVLTSIMHPPGLQRFALTVDRPASAPRADGLRRAYYGPSHGRNAVQLFSIRGGTTIAACYRMRRVLGFLAGVLVGQWLVFGGALSPAALHIRASAAWEHRDYPEALRLWSQAVSLQPGNAELHYLREPQSTIAREAIDGLAGLQPTAAGDGEVLVPLESGLGVWIVPALVNGHRGRFLLDTGSSVIVIGPSLAAAAGLKPALEREAIELQTLGGRTRGPAAVVTSIKVGDALLQDAPVVLHDPGPGVDGILGNTFLSHYLVTVDADRRQLALRSLARSD